MSYENRLQANMQTKSYKQQWTPDKLTPINILITFFTEGAAPFFDLLVWHVLAVVLQKFYCPRTKIFFFLVYKIDAGLDG
jgi:hypothetical protein